MDKVISSPLRYWGGKGWLFKTVFDLIPEGETEIFSPFLGGGSIEINLAYKGYTVHAYDNYAPLVNFWQHYLGNPEAIRRAAYEILSLYCREELNEIRKKNNYWTNDLFAAAFYLVYSNFSFNGLRSSILEFGLEPGGDYIRKPHPKMFGKTKLFTNFDFWKSKPCESLDVKQADFESVFWIHNHQFAYIDPPYFGNEKEYDGSRENGFNHEKLRELVSGRPKTAISYNDHPKAYELYDGYHIQPIKRGTWQSDGKQELLILSPDIAVEQLELFNKL